MEDAVALTEAVEEGKLDTEAVSDDDIELEAVEEPEPDVVLETDPVELAVPLRVPVAENLAVPDAGTDEEGEADPVDVVASVPKKPKVGIEIGSHELWLWLWLDALAESEQPSI